MKNNSFFLTIVSCIIIGGSIIVLAILSYLKPAENSMVVIPLVGTWMGTVLAYYFGKGNFEIASNQFKETLDKILPQEERIYLTPVKLVMLKTINISYIKKGWCIKIVD